jgi:hypothetical protein
MRAPACFEDAEAKLLIERLCTEHRIDITLLTDLSEIVQEFSGSGRREGVTVELSSALDRFLARSQGS